MSMNALERRLAALEARMEATSQARPSRRTAWKVTAANGANWNVQAAYDADNGMAGRTLANVPALAGQSVAVGDYVAVVWLGDGTPRLFAAGGVGTAVMIVAQAAMTADDTAYNCKYLEADGTEGGALSARRPNGIRVDSGDVGYLGRDSSGQNMFIPCHARHDQGLPLTMETRTDDPGGPEVGRLWLRTDEP